jgi:hypothetical protein
VLRQDGENCANFGEFLQRLDTRLWQSDAACGSFGGCLPDVNEDAGTPPTRTIARVVDEKASAVQRCTPHFVCVNVAADL